MEYLVGKKEDFITYLDKIEKNDNIAVIAHNDLDGVASAILIDKVLESRKIKIKDLKFVQLKVGFFENLLDELSEEGITKTFVCDLGVGSDISGFNKLREKFDVFLIDHHPYEISGKGIIKTKTADCATLAVYNLAKDDFDLSKLEWLVCAAMVSDSSYKDENNLEFLKKYYPELTLENVHESELGKLANKISSAITYFQGKEKKVFSLIKKNDLSSFGKYHKIIDAEIKKYVEKFQKEAEYYPEKNLYFYFGDPKYGITSFVTTIVSAKQPNKSFVFVSPIRDEPDYYKVSSRNQSGKEDMNKLMKKGIEGLENATGGGHVPAAAARFMKKDFEKFKENIIS